MNDNLRRAGLTLLIMLVVVLSVAYVNEKAPSEAVEPQTTQIWRITAYCPCSKCCGRWADGITASGAKAEGKLIAAPIRNCRLCNDFKTSERRSILA